MTDIESALRRLAREIDFPSTPDLLRDAAFDTQRRYRPRRRLLAVAVTVVAVAVAAGLALSPGARTAFAELFGIGSVQIVRLDEAPAREAVRLVPFGKPVALEEAARSVPFRIRLPDPDVARRPTRVYLDTTAGAGIVSLVWCCERRVVLTELLTTIPGALLKTVGPATLVEPVRVGDDEGLWLEGSDHVIRVFTTTYPWPERAVLVQGGVLIWASSGLTLRLEGDLSKDEAVAIAEGVR